MPDETPHRTPIESGDFILATYREIALRFGLGGPNAARTKVKRAGWVSEPTNHPADPLRIRVPREAWDQAVETPPRTRRDRPHLVGGREAPSQDRDTRYIKALEGHIATLREQLERERGRTDQAEQERARLVVEIDGFRAEAARLRTEAEVAQVARQKAEEQLAEAEAWQQRPWWRRLRRPRA